MGGKLCGTERTRQLLSAFKLQRRSQNSDSRYCVSDWAAAAFESGIMHHGYKLKDVDHAELGLFVKL